VRAAPHLDDHERISEPAVDFYEPVPDDVVAQERDRVRGERELGEALYQLDGARPLR
jgi:hypothetical protein